MASVPPQPAHPARLVAFVALAFGLSWAWWVPMALSGAIGRNGVGWPTHLPGLLGPALAAVIVVAVTERGAGLLALLRSALRWGASWWLWLAVAVTAALVLLPLITGGWDPDAALSYSGAPAWGLAVIPFVLVLNGFGEELGWRGYLVDRLSRRLRLPVVAGIVWLVWALWHLPLFWVVANFRDFDAAGVVGWLVGLLSGSILLTWMYVRGSRSVLLVAAWHTAFNFASATAGSTGVAAAVASTIVIIAAVTILVFPSTWRRPNAEPEPDRLNSA